MKALLKDLLGFFILIIVLVLCRIYVIAPIQVQGESMMPTLSDGEKALAYRLGNIKRFDVVPLVATDDPSLNYIKRVIGIPGDRISYQQDQLFINGEKVSETYLDQSKEIWKNLQYEEPFTEDFTLEEVTGFDVVPEGYYFVLGDNRRVSKDSRDTDVGLIPKDNIIGTAKIAIWPPSQWGLIQ